MHSEPCFGVTRFYSQVNCLILYLGQIHEADTKTNTGSSQECSVCILLGITVAKETFRTGMKPSWRSTNTSTPLLNLVLLEKEHSRGISIPEKHKMMQ